ncbi:hypothetical protein B0H16DRAFT_1758911 [Mycena metata]|uniref:Uncharacterized protein n=1 Tax=Mycena metata TaxID=1033252 RepID=A0AAD7MZ26_9AGAR|nr:hypothetical protein B0H16DRAFT_1758911 [Mycena metata]
MPWTWPLCVKNRFADAPASVPTLEELQDITEVLVAKYDVEFIVPAVKQHLQRLKTSKPLAVYALGVKYGWKDIASSAAKESLKIPLRALGNNAPPELREMTAIATTGLKKYTFMDGMDFTVPRWFSAFLSTMSGVLETTPGVILHENSNFHVALGQYRCKQCNIFNDFIDFVFSEWPAKLGEELDKIELKF